MGRGGKARIAASSAAALRDHEAFIGVGEVVYALAGFVVVHNGADRDFQQHILAFATTPVGAFAMPPSLCLVFRVVAEMYERVVTLARLHDDVAAAAAIPA